MTKKTLRVCWEETEKRHKCVRCRKTHCALFFYFKLLRAEEEVRRLNIEIRRLITFISDYHKKTSEISEELTRTNAKLGHQLRKQMRLRKRHDINHLHRLRQLGQLEGFSGFIYTGQAEGEGGDNIDSILEALGEWDGASTSSSDDELDYESAVNVDTTLETVLRIA